jgi:hypothetical protein
VHAPKRLGGVHINTSTTFIQVFKIRVANTSGSNANVHFSGSFSGSGFTTAAGNVSSITSSGSGTGYNLNPNLNATHTVGNNSNQLFTVTIVYQSTTGFQTGAHTAEGRVRADVNLAEFDGSAERNFNLTPKPSGNPGNQTEEQ